MREFGVAEKNLYVEKQSGKDFMRPKLLEMLSKLQKGDVLCLHSLDRLGRSYSDLQKFWRMITQEIGADIVVFDMPLLDTRQKKDLLGTFISELVLSLLAYISQSEREMIHKRQAEGIAVAKIKGVRFGRPIKATPDNFAELVRQWEQKQLSTDEILQMCKMSQTTFYRRRVENGLIRGKND
jgi:DNA invertase Pin-like site-specific DNA recombinase